MPQANESELTEKDVVIPIDEELEGNREPVMKHEYRRSEENGETMDGEVRRRQQIGRRGRRDGKQWDRIVSTISLDDEKFADSEVIHDNHSMGRSIYHDRGTIWNIECTEVPSNRKTIAHVGNKPTEAPTHHDPLISKVCLIKKCNDIAVGIWSKITDFSRRSIAKDYHIILNSLRQDSSIDNNEHIYFTLLGEQDSCENNVYSVDILLTLEGLERLNDEKMSINNLIDELKSTYGDTLDLSISRLFLLDDEIILSCSNFCYHDVRISGISGYYFWCNMMGLKFPFLMVESSAIQNSIPNVEMMEFPLEMCGMTAEGQNIIFRIFEKFRNKQFGITLFWDVISSRRSDISNFLYMSVTCTDEQRRNILCDENVFYQMKHKENVDQYIEEFNINRWRGTDTRIEIDLKDLSVKRFQLLEHDEFKFFKEKNFNGVDKFNVGESRFFYRGKCIKGEYQFVSEDGYISKSDIFCLSRKYERRVALNSINEASKLELIIVTNAKNEDEFEQFKEKGNLKINKLVLYYYDIGVCFFMKQNGISLEEVPNEFFECRLIHDNSYTSVPAIIQLDPSTIQKSMLEEREIADEQISELMGKIEENFKDIKSYGKDINKYKKHLRKSKKYGFTKLEEEEDGLVNRGRELEERRAGLLEQGQILKERLQTNELNQTRDLDLGLRSCENGLETQGLKLHTYSSRLDKLKFKRVNPKRKKSASERWKGWSKKRKGLTIGLAVGGAVLALLVIILAALGSTGKLTKSESSAPQEPDSITPPPKPDDQGSGQGNDDPSNDNPSKDDPDQGGLDKPNNQGGLDDPVRDDVSDDPNGLKW